VKAKGGKCFRKNKTSVKLNYEINNLVISFNDCFTTSLFVLVKKKVTLVIWDYYFSSFGN
jgi:hypothetical protein